MEFNDQKYFVKVFQNVNKSNTKLDTRAVKSIFTLMQTADSEHSNSNEKFAILKVPANRASTRFMESKPSTALAIRLLKIDVQTFINYWDEA